MFSNILGAHGPGAAIGSLIDPETAENKAPPCLARLKAKMEKRIKIAQAQILGKK